MIGTDGTTNRMNLRSRAFREAMSDTSTTTAGRAETTSITAEGVVARPLRSRPIPAWAAAADRIHSSDRAAAPAVADGAAVLAAVWAGGVPLRAAAAATLLLLAALHLAGVYRTRSSIETQGILWYPGRVVTALAVTTLGVALTAARTSLGDAAAFRFGASAVVGLLAVRWLSWTVVAGARRAGVARRPTLVVGSGPLARVVVDKLRSHPEVGLEPVGILSPEGRSDRGSGIAVDALPRDLPSLVRRADIGHIVLVPEGNQDAAVAECLELCDELDVTFSMLPPLAELYLHPGLVNQVGGLPLVSLGRMTLARTTQPGKRLIDVVGALAFLALVAPVLVVTTIAILIADGRPVLYRQRRVGRGGGTFEMLKFRSMVPGAERMLIDLADDNVTDGLLFKVVDDPRVTRVGRVLRKFSIDELPQLWNVVRGDMSLVGPRPLAVDPSAFAAMDGKRHAVRPGITGYWQLAGGNGLTYQEMVKLDLAYIKNWSMWVDFHLLLRTVPAVFTRDRHGAV